MLAACLLALTAVSCTTQGANEPVRSASNTGYVGAVRTLTLIPPVDRQPAPEVSGVELGKDATISTTDYPGKVIVLNVWGSWCGPCKAEAPSLQQASQDTKDIAQFLGLNTRDVDQGPPLAFNRARGITYPSIYDPTGSTLVLFAGKLPLTAIPSTLVIDEEGRMAARIVGSVTTETLVEVVRDVSDGR